MEQEGKQIEIVLGNKNVAEAGSTQVNITQNNFDPTKLEEVLKGLSGLSGSKSDNSDNCDNSDNVNVKPQTVQTSQTPQTNKAKRPKVVTTTFLYRWLQTDANRIGLLYQALLRATVNGEPTGWIAADTKPKDFERLFSGVDSSVQIKWIGTKQHLKYLFKVMWERKYISIANGGKQKWVVVQSHFVDSDRRMFTDWDKEQDPVQYKNAIETIADILNADLTLEEVMRLNFGR